MTAPVKSLEEFKEFLSTSAVGKQYLFPKGFLYKKFEIEIESDGQFTWCLEHNFDARRRNGHCYPSNGFIIQVFKTEKGVKKNLLKKLEYAIDTWKLCKKLGFI